MKGVRVVYTMKLKISEEFSCFLIIASSALAVRAIVSLNTYSGYNKPPMFGDYEAQRHWQEICVNLPISEWYKNSTDNDLLYWGLDYPPLTAYHSLLIGKIAQHINASYVELHTSRGMTTEEHKYFMRNSVLFSDAIVYIPAIIYCVTALQGIHKRFREFGGTIAFFYLLYPGQILIDNGHFQYNNMSLGLLVFAIALIIKDKDVWAAIIFSLALNYKQMELYHSLPFFIYLLRKCFPGNQTRFLDGFKKLSVIAIVVLATFGILWLPWLTSYNAISAVMVRLFPLARGIFEDKVSNFWCVLNVFVKIKEIIPNEAMALISLGATLIAILPSNIDLFINPKQINFLYCLVNTSLGFFLFSFQVHEKSILLPSIPVLLLYPFEPFFSFWFLQVSTFSMFPLLEKDGLVIPFIALNILHFTLNRHFYGRLENKRKHRSLFNIYYLGLVLNIVTIFGHVFIKPPEKLPHLFSLLISLKVTDESDGCGGKFSAVVVSCMFEGKKLLQRHRLVNSVLSEELKEIHAFSQKTFTVKEWEDQAKN